MGSDTLQDVLNGLANGTSITGCVCAFARRVPRPFGSFDATGSTLHPDQVRRRPLRPSQRLRRRRQGAQPLDRRCARTPPAPSVARPTSRSPARWTSPVRRPAPPRWPAGPLLYIPFGRDALAYAHTGGTNASFDDVDQATLKGMFECTITQSGGVTVVPVIPQAGSGTRKDWLRKIGATETSMQEVSEGGCVQVGQEHDTKNLANGDAFPANAVTPMSAAQWVAQNTGAGIDRIGAGAKIGTPVAGTSAGHGHWRSDGPEPRLLLQHHLGSRHLHRGRERPRDRGRPEVRRRPRQPGEHRRLQARQHTSSACPSQAGSVKKKYGFLAPTTTVPFRAALSA